MVCKVLCIWYLEIARVKRLNSERFKLTYRIELLEQVLSDSVVGCPHLLIPEEVAGCTPRISFASYQKYQ